MKDILYRGMCINGSFIVLSHGCQLVVDMPSLTCLLLPLQDILYSVTREWSFQFNFLPSTESPTRGRDIC